MRKWWVGSALRREGQGTESCRRKLVGTFGFHLGRDAGNQSSENRPAAST